MALVKAGEEFQGFHDAHLVRKRGGLKGGADFVFERVGLLAGIVAADDRSAAIGVAQTFEDFDSAGFTGTIGAEEAEDFSLVDVETDAADGFDVAIALDEIFDSYNGFGHKEKLQSLQQTLFLRLPSTCRDHRRRVEW